MFLKHHREWLKSDSRFVLANNARTKKVFAKVVKPHSHIQPHHITLCVMVSELTCVAVCDGGGGGGGVLKIGVRCLHFTKSNLSKPPCYHHNSPLIVVQSIYVSASKLENNPFLVDDICVGKCVSRTL